MRPSFLALAFLACAGSLLRAQTDPQPPSPPEQPPRPTFRAGTNLVRVDVNVTDPHGQPILDLAQNEFEIFEDGRPQSIESFKLVQLSGAQDASDEESLPIRSVEHGRAEAARDEVRLFAIFLDDYHVNRMAETIRAQGALTDFVRNDLGPRDLVTLMDPLTPLDALRFTRDRDELVRQIKTFQGRRGVYVPTRSAAEDEQLAHAQSIERVRTEVTLSALKALVTRLGSIRESRKAVIFLSSGFGVSRDLWSEFTEVFQAASQNNTAIYPLDPGWLDARRGPGLDALRILADNSGGRAIVNTNSFKKPLAQVVRDASAYYLIGYTSTRPEPDGRFREIKVRVSRRGADVRARKGYWALTEAEARRATEVTAAPPAEIARAFAPLSISRGGRPIDTWIGMDRGGVRGLTHVVFAWSARPQSNGAGAALVGAVQVTAYDAAGREQFAGAAPPVPLDAASPSELTGSTAFDLPPGTAKLKIDVQSTAGEPIDFEVRDITVPDLWMPPVSLSTPRVVRARSGSEFQRLTAAMNPPVASSREFRRTDRLLIRVAAHAKDDTRPTVTARLVSTTGAVLTTLPVSPSTTGGATHQMDLPLASLAAGDYIVRIEAVLGDATATELVPLRVR